MSRSTLPFFVGLLAASSLGAQSLNMVSGNGQIVSEQFLSNAPFVVQAKDASGQPAAGVSVTWTITQGSGTIVLPVRTTDASGLATASFLATSVNPGQSFFASTVTAATAAGSVNFVITTVQSRLSNGGLAAPPLVVLITPPAEDRNITAASGSTVKGAVVVRVVAQSGIQQGQAIPNVGVRIGNNQDPTSAPPAACVGPNGLVLTDATGLANCDLAVTGQPGTTQLTAVAGESQNTPVFNLQITPAVTCTYSLSALSQSFGSSGGSGSVNVVTAANCGWTAASNVSWIVVAAGANGVGNGGVTYNVGANTGTARTGTITIAGKTFTVNQSGAAPGSLAITTGPTLPPGTLGTFYSTTLAAIGGSPPYTWSISGSLPFGLTLNGGSGVISGIPSAVGSVQFLATVRDNAGAAQSQAFSLSVGTGSDSGGFTIVNTSFPSGVVGQPYQQLLSAIGGCVNPFSPAPSFVVSSGSLPAGLTLQTNSDRSTSIAGTPTTAGTASFSLTATDACLKTATASFAITITGGPVTTQQLTASTSSISFTVQAGAANIPADQTFAVNATSGVLNYTVTIATNSGGNWLVLKSPLNGTTPGSISVGVVNFSSLPAGQYNGTITIVATAPISSVVVPVALTVLPVPVLTASPLAFTVNQIASNSGPVARQAIAIAAGTSSVPFTAVATTQSGGPWLAVSPTSGNTPAALTAIVVVGGLAPGTYLGSVTITPSGGQPQSVSITLNVLPPATLVASPAPLSISLPFGGALAQRALAVTSTGSPVTFAVSANSVGNWLSVTPNNSTTPVNLTVTANPTGLAIGAYPGSLTITPIDTAIVPLTINVALSVTAGPPSIASVTNAASFAPGPVSPGELITIFGSGMGPDSPAQLQLNAVGLVDTTLAGTQVFFDNFPSPMVYSSPGQVSAFVPYEVTGKSTVQVRVQYLGVRSNELTVRVIDSVPGIFTIDPSGQGAILNQDNTINSTLNGALPGSYVSIFATGEGLTDPLLADGTIVTIALPRPRLRVTVQIAGQDAPVIYAGGAPSEPAGILQVNAQVPAGLVHGTSVPVVITVGTASSQPGVTLAIR